MALLYLSSRSLLHDDRTQPWRAMTAIIVVVAVISEMATPGVHGAQEHVGGRYCQDTCNKGYIKKQGEEQAHATCGEAECVWAWWDHCMSCWVI